jgi:glycosyltransferase involved in cell wall biosynthesis
MTRPLLSILTPSYNYARFLGDCLASVGEQGLANVQHVVVDDQSTDDSAALLASSQYNPTWDTKLNGGLSDTLNACVARAEADWLGWLNADDYYLPGTFRVVLDALERNPGADFIFGDSVYADHNGRMLGLHAQHGLNRSVLRWMGTHIAPCALFFRKSVLPEHVFDTRLQMLMDWDLCLGYERQRSTFIYLPRPLGVFRRHEQQTSAPGASREEHAYLRKRYGLPRGDHTMPMARKIGLWEHRLHKIAIGSYLRERRAGAYMGQDTRWFLGPQQLAVSQHIVRAGSSPHRSGS